MLVALLIYLADKLFVCLWIAFFVVVVVLGFFVCLFVFNDRHLILSVVDS